MLDPEFAEVLPRNKLDLERAERAVALGYPGIAPVVPQLLEWLQDVNWPVAHVLQPMLASIGSPISNDVRAILVGQDFVWSQWILECVVFYSDELFHDLRPEIARLAALPRDDPEASDLADSAQELLRRKGLRSSEV
jgi:hypothetical protein